MAVARADRQLIERRLTILKLPEIRAPFDGNKRPVD